MVTKRGAGFSKVLLVLLGSLEVVDHERISGGNTGRK